MQAAQLDGHIVRTSNLRGGLDEYDVSEAIRILNENWKRTYKTGLLHLDAEGIFFAPKLYGDTARGRKND